MPDDFRMPAAEPRQPLAVQHIDAANRVGDHGMPMTAMFEQRHLAEEIAFMNLMGCPGTTQTVASPLPMKYIAPPASPAGTMVAPAWNRRA